MLPDARKRVTTGPLNFLIYGSMNCVNQSSISTATPSQRHPLHGNRFTASNSHSMPRVFLNPMHMSKNIRPSRTTRQPPAWWQARGHLNNAIERTTKQLTTHNYCKLHRLSTAWSRPGSNRQPLACKASALPVELRPRHSAGQARLYKTRNPLGRIHNRFDTAILT
jgi:hypothetical protein